jgi:hypothetical protein
MTAPSPPTFETGTPKTGAELAAALGQLLAQGTAFLQTLGDAEFFAPQGTYWSPSEHVRHLRKSAAAVTSGLNAPRWFLTLRFGRAKAPSRTFTQIVEAYRAVLSAGATAGRFTPARESSPGDPAARRNEVLNAWAAATVGLQNAIRGWDEFALDRYVLPHPILGPLTVREMLHFTVYHTAHHLRRVAERSGR